MGASSRSCSSGASSSTEHARSTSCAPPASGDLGDDLVVDDGHVDDPAGILGHDRAVDVATGRGLDRVPARPERQGHEPVRLDRRQVDRVRTSPGFRVGDRAGVRFLDVRLELAGPDGSPEQAQDGRGRRAARTGSRRRARGPRAPGRWSRTCAPGWNVDVDNDSPMARAIASWSCHTEATIRSPSSLEPWRPTWTSTSPGSFRRSGSISVRRIRSNSPCAGRNRNRRRTERSGSREPVLDPPFADTRQGYRMASRRTHEKTRRPASGRLVRSGWEDQADGLASGCLGLVTGLDVSGLVTTGGVDSRPGAVLLLPMSSRHRPPAWRQG